MRVFLLMVDVTRKGQTVDIGYTLSSEERQPQELVRLAREAENAGFAYALISDQYHPWTDKQATLRSCGPSSEASPSL